MFFQHHLIVSKIEPVLHLLEVIVISTLPAASDPQRQREVNLNYCHWLVWTSCKDYTGTDRQLKGMN